MKHFIMSTSIVPGGFTGTVYVQNITVEEAISLLKKHKFVSAVGHASTATLLSTLLDREILANRITVKVEELTTFLCFQLASRPPEGAILDLATLEKIGFSLRVMVLHPEA